MFWWWTLWVRWSDYELREGKRWERERRVKELGWWGGVGVVAIALGYLFRDSVCLKGIA
jgi:hypothetical protein